MTKPWMISDKRTHAPNKPSTISSENLDRSMSFRFHPQASNVTIWNMKTAEL